MATTKTEQNKKSEQTLSFEQGLARLDEIISLLERDNAPLQDLMALYEEGVGLLRTCNDRLDQAEQKVKILRMAPEENKVYLQDFDADGQTDAQASKRGAKETQE